MPWPKRVSSPLSDLTEGQLVGFLILMGGIGVSIPLSDLTEGQHVSDEKSLKLEKYVSIPLSDLTEGQLPWKSQKGETS